MKTVPLAQPPAVESSYQTQAHSELVTQVTSNAFLHFDFGLRIEAPLHFDLDAV